MPATSDNTHGMYTQQQQPPLHTPTRAAVFLTAGPSTALPAAAAGASSYLPAPALRNALTRLRAAACPVSHAP
jgi:hypothetical protein